MPPRIPLATALPRPLLRQIARTRRPANPASLVGAAYTGSTYRALSPHPAATRQLSSTSPLLLPKRSHRQSDALAAPSPSALSALLSRLSLAPSTDLHPSLLACLTHPSFLRALALDADATPSSASSASPIPTESVNGESNELLSALGNSLLGLFASEHLAATYPYLPTEALQGAVTAHVGPAACFAVARELGVGVQQASALSRATDEEPSRRGAGAGAANVPAWKRRAGEHVALDAVRVRWVREVSFDPVAPARRFRRAMSQAGGGGADGEGENGLQAGGRERKEGWEDVVAGVVKAFVGLVYQEKGMHAARQFVHAHFLSRHLDMTTLFNFRNPLHILSRVVAKHLSDAASAAGASGAGSTAAGDLVSREGTISSRLLSSTGRNTQSPLYNIGLFLPSGLKLAEGVGGSLKMAEWRAASNALYALFLVRRDARDGGGAGVEGINTVLNDDDDNGDAGAGRTLPTAAHGVWALEGGRVGRGGVYDPIEGIHGGKEVVVESNEGKKARSTGPGRTRSASTLMPGGSGMVGGRGGEMDRAVQVKHLEME